MMKKFTQSASLLSAKWILAFALPFLAFQSAQAQLNYVATACSDPYVQAQGQTGTTLLGSGDDVIFANVALPFAFTLYTTSYTTVNIGTNGFVVFLPGTNRGLGNANLPTAIAGACLYPFWDDLDINPATTPLAGVYTRVDGVAPNRVFTIEWFNAGHFPDVANQTVTFQVRLFEGTTRVQYKYLDVIFGGTQNAFNNGLSATVGLEGPLPAPRPFTLFSFNTASLSDGQCTEWILPPPCNPIPTGTVNANTDPGTCVATATVGIPAFNPTACADGITVGLRYSVNGGAFVTVPAPFPPTITFPNLPKGANVITWQTFLIPSGATAGSATQTVNVIDNQPPTLTCPPNQFINLDPGACCAIVSWPEPTATDNCPFIIGPFTVNTINTGGNANSVGGMVSFNINNTSGQTVLINAFGMNISAATIVNVYRKAGTHVGFETQPAAWTLVGTANANTGPFSGPFPGNGTITPALVNGTIAIPPGLSGITLHTPTAQQNYTNGNGANQTFSDANITLNLGSAANTLWGAPFTPRVWNGFVRYQIGGAAVVVLQTPLGPGSEFCKDQSPYTIQYQVADAAGLTATCSFSIVVNEYSNPITTMVCNDLVYVSLDATCTTTLTADQILEGGPYGCYDDYIVQIDKSPPYGNGPWVPAVLGPGDIGKTYAVQVTDPTTNNKCWGNIKVEDKLAPTLDCPPADAFCNMDLTPCAVEPFFVQADPAQFPASFENHGSGTVFSLSGNTLPGGVYFDLTNNGGAPLTVTGFGVRFGNPQFGVVNPPQTMQVFTAPTFVGNETTAGAWTNLGPQVITTIPPYFATGTGPLAQLSISSPVVIPGGQKRGFHIFGATACPIFNYNFGQIPPITNGPWTLAGGAVSFGLFGPLFNAGANAIPNIQVNYGLVLDPPCLPNGLVLGEDAVQTSTNCYTADAGSGNPLLDACSDVTLCYVDQSVDQPCASGLTKIVNRKWTAKDASGNQSTCIQQINVFRPKLTDVVFAPDYDGIDAPALECGGSYPTPDYIEGLGLQGYPSVFGSSDGCSIGWTYTDVVIEVCDGTYKIRREWVAIDWCTGTDLEDVQIIKVLDEEGPSLSCPANLTVSTDPFNCCATINLPDMIISDNCSRINNIGGMVIAIDQYTLDTIGMFPFSGELTDFPGNNYWVSDTLGAFGVSPCLPIGTHTVVYQAEDDCGNTSTCTFRVTVRDYIPPVIACTEYTVVGIGVDDPYDCYEPSDDCNGAGVTWVKATVFDQGSDDNCNNLKFTIRRMAPYSECIQNLNSVNGHPDCDDFFPDFPSEFERAVAEQDSIKFYCCEVGTTQMVVLRVYQVDANGNFTIGPDGTPVYNECMIEVEVQDKIKPVCTNLGTVTVNCEAFDPSLWAYGKPAVYDNCCLDTTKVYQGQCGLTHTVNYSLFDTVCNRGTITRTFRVFDCQGQQGQCTQRIVVTYEQDYFIKFPNDRIITECNGSGDYGAPTFLGGQDCELLGVSYEDEIFTVVPDACRKIERTWTIINWCTYNPNAGCINVPNPNPNPNINSPQNLPGPTVSACGTPAPWNPTVVAIAPGQPATNYCTFYDPNANCYKYKQIIKIIDNEDPIVSNCPPSPVTFCDLTTNNPLLWNQSYWWDSVISSHDLCEGDAPLTITATDSCSEENLSITYLLFLDLDGDGTMETVVNSNNPPAPGTVQYNNAGNPNYSGGVTRTFDGRPVPSSEIYRWANHQSVSGIARTASVQWKTQSQLPTPSNQFGSPGIAPQLPYGTHKIKWQITDGCGNEAFCEYQFIVKDCKAPTVVCLDLGVNIMPTQMIQLWATDFLQYGEDNCTPADQLKYSIRKAGQGVGFPVDVDGNPVTNIIFTCAELGIQKVELWAMDAAGNADFCVAELDVQDNGGFCDPNAKVDVAGALKTDADQGLKDANVNLQATTPNGGNVDLFMMTDNSGQYSFPNSVPVNSNMTVTPTKDDNPLNGVSTYDLVLISKHILGLEPLPSPYKMIAADANKSNSITTFDIVEIRKLILGIYNELPNNTSWRFVEKSYVFPTPSNPFATQFPEVSTVQGVTVDQVLDFTAIKIGDVNGTAIPNSLVSADDRTASTLLFDVEDRQVNAGETFEVTFKAAEKVQGWQFTTNLTGLEVVDIVENDKVKTSNFGVFADAMTTSVDGDATEFAVKFRAAKSGKLSDMLGVSSRITRAEAYSLSNNRMDVAFRFNGQGGSTIAGVGFELYQNQPNPFVNHTLIGFHLPQAADATLSIFDETGRMLFTQKGQFGKGYNAIAVDRALLNTNGLMYYKLETTTDSATKKMIQTK